MRTITGTLRPTPTQWLPVLSNIAPPHLRRQEASAKFLSKIRNNNALPVFNDIFHHPPARLPSRHPIWSDNPDAPFDLESAWKAEWAAAEVHNHQLIVNPTVWSPGISLPRRLWSNLNRFRTGQGRCASNLHKWGLAADPLCNCGQIQTMSHIVDTCPQTRFAGGLHALHLASDAAIRWLDTNCLR